MQNRATQSSSPFAASSTSRSAPKRRASAAIASAARAAFEPLESRQLMSGVLSISAGGANPSVTLDATDTGGVITIINGVETDYGAGQWNAVQVFTSGSGVPVNVRASVVPTTINATGSANVTFNSLHGVQDVKASVAVVTAAGGSSTVHLDETGDNTARSATLDISGAYQTITGLAPATISFTAAQTGVTDIKMGGGVDTLNVRAISAANDVLITNVAGNDTVTVGSATAGTQNIIGPISVHNAPALTHLIVDDAADPTRRTITLTGNGTNDTIAGVSTGTINFRPPDMADVTLKTPAAGADVAVLRTDKPTTISGNSPLLGPDDTIVVGGALGDMTHIAGALTLFNASGYDNVWLNDKADATARLAVMGANSVTGLSPAAVKWSPSSIHAMQVNLPGAGGSAASIGATTAPTVVRGDAPANGTNDTITIGQGGSVQSIAGSVTVAADSGSINLQVDDSADGTARNATLSVTPSSDMNHFYPMGTITGLAPAAILYRTFDVNNAVQIKAGSGGNTITVQDTPTSTIATLYGPTINLSTGTGADTVNVQGTGVGTVLNIEGQNGFDAVTFSKAGSVQGIRGSVIVRNTGARSTLTVDDSADATSRTSGLGTMPSGDTHPFGTIVGLAPGAIDYVANDMNDPVTIRGGSGGNTITVNDTPLKTTGSASGNIINLFTGTGVDHVQVNAVGAGTTLNVEGQNGADQVMLGSGGSVQNIAGAVNLSNANQAENVLIDDSGDAAACVVTLGVSTSPGGLPTGTITGLAPGAISYVAAGAIDPVIDGGSGGNIFTVTGTPTIAVNGNTGPTTYLNAGGGDDIVNVDAMSNGTGLHVNGQAGSDVVSVDYSTGTISLSSSVTFDGGVPGAVGNTLSITGKAADSFVLTDSQITHGKAHVDHANVTTLYVKGGSYSVNQQPNIANFVALSPSTFVHFNSYDVFDALAIDGANADLYPSYEQVLTVGSLTIQYGGHLDLAYGAMIVRASAGALGNVAALVKSGCNGNTWTGPGLDSAAAAADTAHRALGYGSAAAVLALGNAPSGTYMGQTVFANDVLVRTTIPGDANLDGKVDFADFVRLSNNFGQTIIGGTPDGWTRGDFNSEGKVDFADFVLLSNNFGAALPPPV